MACIEGYLAATYEVYIGWDTEACYVCHGILTKYIKWLRATHTKYTKTAYVSNLSGTDALTM